MKSIYVGGKSYNYVIDIENEKLLDSFNDLANRIFGFTFESWYHDGYKEGTYTPHMLIDGDKVISNTSVNEIDFIVNGEKKKCIQIGTVMTDKEYRGKGLSKALLRAVLEEWKDKCDLVYLFANDNVIDFYPKFNFARASEYIHSKEIKKSGEPLPIIKLDMKEEENKKLLADRVKDSMPISKVSMIGNAPLILFHAKSFMQDSFYYIEELDTIVVMGIRYDTLYLNDVFAPKGVTLDEIISAVATDKVSKVVFGFTPLDTNECDVSILKEEDNTLFMLGEGEFFGGEKVRFPLLSQA